MRCVVFHGTGGREAMAVEDRPDPRPGRFDVLIAPRYAGVNPADVLQREGRHPVPAGYPADIPGLEVAGPVVEVGDGVTGFAPGDRAFGLVGGGGHAQLVLAEERQLLRVPDAIDDRAAAAAPQSFLTAFDALVNQGRMRAGDVVLVNGAGGGVGSAAVQIAACMRARVIASVRSEAVRSRVAGLGGEALAPGDAFERVRALGGADVIVELVGAPHMPDNMQALARGGRLVLVAGKPGEEVAVALRDLMSRRASLIGTTLRTRPAEEKAALVQEFGRRVAPFLGDGTMVAHAGEVFPLERAADAYDQVRTPGRFGKTLLELPPA